MAITQVIVPTPQQTLTNILQTLTAGLIKLGIVSPQVDPSSDFYVLSQLLTNQLGLGFQQLVAIANAVMADTAVGDDLTRYAAIFGVNRKDASSSTGFVLVSCTSNTSVAVNTQLTSNSGLVYQVVTGKQLVAGSSPSTNLVEVVSVDTGASTNLPVNSIMNWVATPAFCKSTVSVYFSEGLIGGADAETDSALRTRLLNNFQNAPAYGNWQQIANTATNASPFIEHAFVYPAINGPSTQSVAFTTAQTPSNIVNRGVLVNSLGWLDGYSAVYSNAPAFVQTIIPYATYTDGYNYSIENATNDVSFSINIPFPVGSTNNGVGGGWVNFGSGTLGPFPNPVVSTFDVKGNGINAAVVNSVIPGGSIVVSAYAIPNTPPEADPSLIAGVSQISWVADFTSQNQGWKVLTATVSSFTFTPVGVNYGNYTLTLAPLLVDGNGNGPQVGDFIFPAIINGQTYLDDVLQSYANLGPGQMNNLQQLFPNSYRQPLVTLQNPDVVDARFCQSLVVNNTEVETAVFYYNFSMGQEPNLPSQVLPAPGNAPSIWVPGKIGFYATGL